MTSLCVSPADVLLHHCNNSTIETLLMIWTEHKNPENGCFILNIANQSPLLSTSSTLRGTATVRGNEQQNPLGKLH